MAWQESRWAASAWQQNPGIHKRRWALHEEEELELGLDDELECELSGVEITKELSCLYFAETENEDQTEIEKAGLQWQHSWMLMACMNVNADHWPVL